MSLAMTSWKGPSGPRMSFAGGTPEAELTPWAVEINVVRTGRLWPRSIAPPRASTETA